MTSTHIRRSVVSAMVGLALTSSALAATPAFADEPPGGAAGGPATATAASTTVERVGGADRFEVSAAISARTFAPDVPVMYIASGAVYSDALSASAAAGAFRGGVLLVEQDGIPPVITDELTRLRPQQIVVMGGEATVSRSVEVALHAYSSSVTRVGGADRYEVSAAVSGRTFGTARPVAFIASGAVFSDALSASAAAGHLGGPVLLTDKTVVPPAILSELNRLNPARIVVLGGATTVSDAVLARLGTIAPTTRIKGADRFEVSATTSLKSFTARTGAPVYVASGTVFADALSGGAAAIATGSPVLLVEKDVLPPSVATEIQRLDPSEIIVLGGTNSVSAGVAAALGRL